MTSYTICRCPQCEDHRKEDEDKTWRDLIRRWQDAVQQARQEGRMYV